MGWNYYFNFFKENKNIDKEFIHGLVEILRHAGWVYRGYWSNEKNEFVYECPLEEAIEVSYKQGDGCFDMSYNNDGNDMYFLIMFGQNKLGMLEVTISVERVYLFNVRGEDYEIRNARNADILLNISEKLYDFLHPFYGYADHQNVGPDNEELISKNIRHIYWANFFSPELVQKIGREKLLSAPCWKVKELKDKGILLVLNPVIYNCNGLENVEKHLGFTGMDPIDFSIV